MVIRNQHSVQSLRCARDYCLYYYYYLFYLYTPFRVSLCVRLPLFYTLHIYSTSTVRLLTVYNLMDSSAKHESLITNTRLANCVFFFDVVNICSSLC